MARIACVCAVLALAMLGFASAQSSYPDKGIPVDARGQCSASYPYSYSCPAVGVTPAKRACFKRSLSSYKCCGCNTQSVCWMCPSSYSCPSIASGYCVGTTPTRPYFSYPVYRPAPQKTTVKTVMIIVGCIAGGLFLFVVLYWRISRARQTYATTYSAVPIIAPAPPAPVPPPPPVHYGAINNVPVVPLQATYQQTTYSNAPQAPVMVPLQPMAQPVQLVQPQMHVQPTTVQAMAQANAQALAQAHIQPMAQPSQPAQLAQPQTNAQQLSPIQAMAQANAQAHGQAQMNAQAAQQATSYVQPPPAAQASAVVMQNYAPYPVPAPPDTGAGSSVPQPPVARNNNSWMGYEQ